jgi:flavin reductase (DIM6/NTAB) family NADH-FMN oxidoreductase RutF
MTGGREALDLDPESWEARDLYRLMTSLVIPRPIGWISTVSDSGVHNLAPHSYFNLVATAPPHVVFGSAGIKDTVTNIRQNGEFVVNIVTRAMIEKMNLTAIDAPPDVDEFELAGLAAERATTVRPLRVAGAPAHLECRVVHDLVLGNSVLVVGQVVRVHVDGSVLGDGPTPEADAHLMDPVARLGGRDYSLLGEIITLQRERWAEYGAG